jgi:methyl-accepting chemotaxis protein
MSKLNTFEKAVFAHAQWKRRLRQAIETGDSEWSVEEVRADDRCEFGGWLERLPAGKKTSERYSSLRALHSEFHEAASEVLELALAGRKQEAGEAMRMGSRFMEVSSRLVRTLSQLSETGSGKG